MKRVLTALLLASLSLTSVMASEQPTSKPRLLLMLTIDQLRGDMLSKMKDRFSSSGFRYLMNNGTWFTNAHYQHANTHTAVGHATIFTGGHTAQHGMAANYWFNTQTHQTIYSVGDPEHQIINIRGNVYGRSPKNLSASTIGDELIMASVNQSRVFSVSVKDRGAIIPGGHKGKAFWFSHSGDFVSSSYYYQDYPVWAGKWNNSSIAEDHKNREWRLLGKPNSYAAMNRDDRESEIPLYDLGRTFPHAPPRDFKALRYTPMADKLTLDFVKTLVDAEKIGQRSHTDMLAISFSATDYIGHSFGPNSLEAEDNLLRLDHTLSQLFDFIDNKIGLNNTLIVLSSDHGIAPIPEYSKKQGRYAGRQLPNQMIASLNSSLKKRFSISGNLVARILQPNIYLNLKTIEQQGLNVEGVEKVLAEMLMQMPGVEAVATRTDLLNPQLANSALTPEIRNAFHPTRSGNLLVVPKQHWLLYDNTWSATEHGSPHSYDTHVPIIFSGAGIKHKAVERLVSPADIVATLSTMLRIPLPSGSAGKPLWEVLGGNP